MSLQSKKNVVKIQPNKKSVKSSFTRRFKANKGISKTQLKSKRSLRASSQRPTVSKKKSLKQSGGAEKVIIINKGDDNEIILSYQEDQIDHLKDIQEDELRSLGFSLNLSSNLKEGHNNDFLFMNFQDKKYTLIYLIDNNNFYNFNTNEINKISGESVKYYSTNSFTYLISENVNVKIGKLLEVANAVPAVAKILEVEEEAPAAEPAAAPAKASVLKVIQRSDSNLSDAPTVLGPEE